MAQFPNTTAADGIWTLKKVRRAILGDNWPALVTADEFFANTVLLLQGDTFLQTMRYNIFGDASTNAHDITPVGGVHGTPFSPYNESWSVEFDGSGDNLQMADSDAFYFDGDFTLEAWIYQTAQTALDVFMVQWASGSDRNVEFEVRNGQLSVYMNRGGTNYQAVGGTITTGQWYHVAATLNGTTMSVFIDGQSVGSTTVANNANNSTAPMEIGANGSSYPFNGYVSNARIVKGTALYTSNFTPPTEPLTAISGTSLLTCNANRFIDTSSNDHTITVNGNSAIRGFSPFADTDTVTGSGYFDGNTSYVSAPWSVMPTGTEDFTIEYWIYETDTSDPSYGVLGLRSSPSENFLVYYGFPTAGYYLLFDDTEIQVGATGGRVLNQWSHHAIVRNGDDFTFYINGQVHGTGTYAGKDVTKSFTNVLIGGVDSGGTRELINANLANVRIVKGTAVYTSAFTPPTSPLTAVSGTSLLTLQNRGANRNIGFIDSSHPTRQITRNGNVTQGSFSPFSQDEGKWGNYFDGSDWLFHSDTTAGAFGTSDFTVEFWLYDEGTTNNFAVVISGYNGNNSQTHWGIQIDRDADGNIYWYSSINLSINSTIKLTRNEWTHIAVVRNSGITTMYVNGQSGGSFSDNTDYVSPSGLGISRDLFTSNYFVNGYISNLRLVKGTAVYTSAFTPPTEPLTAISGTSLFTCQSNRFVDNSSNAHAITVNGDPEVVPFSPFSPFAPSTAYDPATKGGSAYFDGGSNYLSTSDTATSVSDFTLSCWYYSFSSAINSSLYPRIISVGGTASASAFLIYQRDDNRIRLYSNSGERIIGSAVPFKQWTHIYLRRSSGVYTLYFNGVSQGTYSNSTGIDFSANIEIGGTSAGGYVTGYIANLQIDYEDLGVPTVPTAPLTKTDSTSLLLNFTNAGIYDGTGRNVLETVGDAHVENSVKKYGTGSMQFDGTGDRLLVPHSPHLDFGTGDFTIEFWTYLNTVGSTDYAFLNRSTGTSEDLWIQYRPTIDATDTLFVSVTSSGYSPVRYPWNPSTDTWYHIAVTRSGTDLKVFIDGTQVGTTQTNSANVSIAGADLYVGYNRDASGQDLNGYIDDLRITKGVARYTANFTPPAAKLPQQ